MLLVLKFSKFCLACIFQALLSQPDLRPYLKTNENIKIQLTSQLKCSTKN